MSALRRFLLCGALAASGASPAAGPAPSTPSSAPSVVEGFSVERLQRIDAFLDAATRPGGHLGAVALVARHGRIVHFKAYGHADLARRTPLRTDAIFRIYSMTKPIASVALLMLLEEGKLALDDPVADYLPAFAEPMVFAGGTADAPQLRAAARPITVRHLLTHTAGFATVGGEEATRLLERADLRGAADLRDYAERASRVPLGADPGTRFRYDGTGTEIASRLVEVVGGMPFERFLQRRIFDPLGMRDTGFSVDGDARSRVPDITSVDAQGRLVVAQGPSAERPGARLATYASGAGGLYSTAEDYLRFCRLLQSGGTVDGKTLLGRKTIDLMVHNHLVQKDLSIVGLPEGEGFGLGVSVLLDAARRGRLGTAGQYGWSGAASTYFTIDPAEDLVAILLLQHLPRDGAHELPKLQHRYYNLVYQALVQ